MKIQETDSTILATFYGTFTDEEKYHLKEELKEKFKANSGKIPIIDFIEYEPEESSTISVLKAFLIATAGVLWLMGVVKLGEYLF